MKTGTIIGAPNTITEKKELVRKDQDMLTDFNCFN
jgi:hypothetical protein